MNLSLILLPDIFAVCRFDRNATVPVTVMRGDLYCIMRTHDELSIVCAEKDAPEIGMVEKGWRMLKLIGPFPFEMTGILASVLTPLAEREVSIFALSTYDTDYVLIKQAQLDLALATLSEAGHTVTDKFPA